MQALNEVGYETPSPIQAQTIPLIIAGKDVLGQAQTGTGKTAAFALPLLSGLDVKKTQPQVLVLTPTRELAIQVAEAFQRYASKLRNFHVLPIYGGQAYEGQLRQLRRGVHVVVGTPGRLMDHMRRGTLKLDALSCLVLDEADEMLRMGFIDDVEWILEQTPAERQTTLFSATIPQPIRRIAQKYLQNPEAITIKVRTTTADTINHRYWMVSGVHKLDALTRILEAETFDGMIVFVRTKTATASLSEKLAARGFDSAPLNGDISQSMRERTIGQLKAGKIDILVATDVAARGLDVDRISHVINYDIPHDTEAYVHRVGRTGRMGRRGEAILFVSPRERRLLHAIERATKQKITIMDLPSTEAVNNKRIANFQQRITDTLAKDELAFFSKLLDQYRQEHDVPALDIAAALALMVQGEEPLLLSSSPRKSKVRPKAPHLQGKAKPETFTRKPTTLSERIHRAFQQEEGMERFRIEVGHSHGVKPNNIVGAIANEVGLDSQNIGRIEIHDDFSTVDLPEGMPRDVFRALKKVWVAGQKLEISRAETPDRPKARRKISHPHRGKLQGGKNPPRSKKRARK